MIVAIAGAIARDGGANDEQKTLVHGDRGSLQAGYLLALSPEARPSVSSGGALADATWGIEGGANERDHLVHLDASDLSSEAGRQGGLDALAAARWVLRWPGSPGPMGARTVLRPVDHRDGSAGLGVEGEAAAQWLEGYRAAGGPPWLETRMLAVTLHCEGSRWAGYHGSPYWTRSQFEEGTWATINAAIGPLDPDSPYDTARATAWWLWAIGPENAGTTAGWPTCFWIETGE